MIRLTADDLTGALDTAAAFTGDGPVRVLLSPGASAPGWRGALAVVSGGRDGAAPDARAMAAAHLRGASLAFCKIDSVLRGAPALDVAAAVGALAPPRIVIAPAFPAQGRVTRAGRQHRRDGEGWAPLRPLLARLAPPGWAPARLWPAAAAPAEGLAEGVHVCDAETDADLAQVAAAGRASAGPTLYVGAAGLAAALATRPAAVTERPPAAPLILFGTPHPATRAQLAALAREGLARPLELTGPAALAAAAQAEIAVGRPALIDLSRLGEGAAPWRAAAAIDAALAALAPLLAPPPRLIAGGGATLAALLRHLNAGAMDVEGQAAPGAPVARIVGGPWHGVATLTKSGGFGDAGFLTRLLGSAG